MWHELTREEVLEDLSVNENKGLTAAEAKKRLEEHGPNLLPSGKRERWWNIFFRQFWSPLVYILLIGAALTFFLKEWIDMSVILLAVTANVAVGFWQEFRSGDILKKLRSIITIHALVLRDEGAVHEINAQDLVPGDIIVLKAGTRVPADARVLAAKRLEVNEALLTGESVPVGKDDTVVAGESVAIGDRENMVHTGTIIERGEGTAIVVATGGHTEIGKIALLTTSTKEEATPLQLRIARLGKFLTYLVGAITVFIFVVGILEDHTVHEMFVTAIAVAVAAIPEGLPAAISIVLAISAQRVLKRKGVVKHLVAAETLGSANIICADKTGTLTEGKMRVEKLITGSGEKRAYEILALANEAIVEKIEGELVVRGEVTDKAKTQAFFDSGGDIDELSLRFPRTSILPFDPSWKYIASLHNTSQDGSMLFVSGAPEILLSLSESVAGAHGREDLTPEKKDELIQTFEKLAAKGYRVIGLAERTLPESGEKYDLGDEKTRLSTVEKLVFAGIAAIRDPIRKDVKESIRIAREAGVRAMMVTGDHALTARAIGGELGLLTEGGLVLEGTEIDGLSDEEFADRIDTVDIFARVNPEHKMRIIQTLQKKGQVVSMSGDGVNDAPALKAADIGVAVDSGTDVAKEASDLVLLNNSFSVIVAAIKQGRIAFDNIRKVTTFLLVDSFTEVMLIVTALALRVPLPISALQILWVNLVEDTLPNIALSFEPGEKDIMRRPPVKKGEPILDRETKFIIFFAGLGADLLLVGVFLLFYYYSSIPLEHIRTFVFATVGINSFFYIYSIKSLRQSLFATNPFNNKYLSIATVAGTGLMLLAIYHPFFNGILETVPLSLSDWSIVVLISVLQVAGIEFVKWWFFHRNAPETGSLKPA